MMRREIRCLGQWHVKNMLEIFIMNLEMTEFEFNALEPNDLFSINISMNIELIVVDGFKILIVDDFYKNPEKLREYLLKSPAPIWKNSQTGLNKIDYWDCRHEHKINSERYFEAQRCIAALARYYLDTIVNKPIFELNSNVLYIKTPRSEPSVSVVHHDDHCLAALVYLNTQDECNGGTGFFRNRFNNVFNINHLSKFEMDALNNWYHLNKLQEDGRSYFLENWQEWWNLEYLAKMRFNRLVIYQGKIFHAAYFDRTAFTINPRLNHMMFFDDVRY
jgi:hypothetical protein